MKDISYDFNYKYKPPRKSKRICKVEGCNNTVVGYNYCSKHYQEYKRFKTIRKRNHKTPNQIIIKNDYAELCLYNINNEVIAKSLIDIEDIEKVSKFKWYQNTKTKYVQTDGNTKYPLRMLLHRYIMNVQDCFNSTNYVDHINMNKLDNRKSNLRLCTNKENMENTPAYKKKFPIKFVYHN